MNGRVFLRCALPLAAAVAAASAAACASAPPSAAAAAVQPEPQPAPPVTITFVGDVLLASRVGRLAARHGGDYLFAEIAHLLRADDLTIANLECTVSVRGVPANKQFTFRARPELLAALRQAGIEVVSLANNHSLDYGRAALCDTLQHLRRAHISATGAGLDLRQASQPIILRAGAQTVALLAASRVLPAAGWAAAPGRAGVASAYDPTRLLREIRAARAAADIVLVYLHWGEEGARRPQSYQRRLACRCIDAGADAVVGAHPHVLQGFEYYRGRLIAYSLGNFLFTNRDRATLLLQLTFRQGRLERAVVVPGRLRDCRPQLVTDEHQRRRLLRELQTRSFGVRIADDGLLSPG